MQVHVNKTESHHSAIGFVVWDHCQNYRKQCFDYLTHLGMRL